MTKRKTKTDGERIAVKTFAPGYDDSYPNAEALAKAIDRAIRRARAEAWEEGFVYGRRGDGVNNQSLNQSLKDNPYKGRAV